MYAFICIYIEREPVFPYLPDVADAQGLAEGREDGVLHRLHRLAGL